MAFNRADSIRSLILRDSFTFSQGIQKFSEDAYSKARNGTLISAETGEPYIELGDLDTEVYFAIDGKEIGAITQPIKMKGMDGKIIYKIIKIRNRTSPHEANLKADYSRVQKAALEEKKARYLYTWIKEHIKEHHIELRVEDIEELKACEFMDTWIKRTP